MDAVPDLSAAAQAMLEGRYLRRGADGHITGTAADLFDEVGAFVARAEDQYEPGSADRWARSFSALMQQLAFLPNSPTLMNAGTRLGILSGCFVLPLEDSLTSIFSTLQHTALLHQAGAGTGYSFGHLRPAGDKVDSTGGTAGGPVSFLGLFDTAVDVVERSGRRRGACLGALDVSHPDILEFVDAKASTPGALSHFALSVAVPDSFLRAVESGATQPLINPRTGVTVGRVAATDVFDAICTAAHRCGDPGILFLDTVNRAHPLPEWIETTNPCGEVPLLPYESCNLGSVNLAACVRDREIDWERLTDTVRVGVRFLDDVIDVSRYPFDVLDRAARRTRKIGLGFMGLAELLATLGVPYDSDRAVEIAEDLARHIARTAHEASAELAATRGAYPAAPQVRVAAARKRRNLQVTSVAPTGSISLLAGTSAGIEPFATIGGRRRILGREVVEIEPAFTAVARDRGCYDDVVGAVLETGTVRTNPRVPADLRAAFPTAVEVAPEWHVRMQAAVQRHVDAAVSKTVLLPASASVAVVREVFLAAWRAGAKGITVFRTESVDDLSSRPRDDHVACLSCT
ncbi:ribonucleoside-diphosphate reductase, adenosylcobalamin-dependent [Rhodococcus sp. WMMA185]|uniref:adenosylcobalamin-dependent ribonucleoside-diphosphate reductase n=1 Tax=Rhodococcus sp. WMMA185 TaxID=679318 RepID=UPI000878A18D|nr:adenosylcobalamin-dependent ribonucleoside-diphosphate reductase [Rhodococcus sp. WMMA185]AOW93616.1 ribonucleoside-diphosphate reductase, adenosylcobalamin-dependent [Rhodococcus sp. WMMA185]